MRRFKYFNEDISIYKDTYFTEAKYVRFEADAGNALHILFCPVDQNWIPNNGNGDFGKTGSQCNIPRRIQFGLQLFFSCPSLKQEKGWSAMDHPFFVFSSNPKLSSQNSVAFLQHQQLIGIHVLERSTGTERPTYFNQIGLFPRTRPKCHRRNRSEKCSSIRSSLR